MTHLDRLVIGFLVLWPFVGWASHDWTVSALGELGETLEAVIFVLLPGLLLLWYLFGGRKSKVR